MQILRSLPEQHVEQRFVGFAVRLYGAFVNFAVFVRTLYGVTVAAYDPACRLVFDFKRSDDKIRFHVLVENDVEDSVSAVVGRYDQHSYVSASDVASDKIREIGFVVPFISRAFDFYFDIAHCVFLRYFLFDFSASLAFLYL